MKELHFKSGREWRQWLHKNHSVEQQGIWLVLDKKDSGGPRLTYEQALQEALCYGWIDSIVRRIDEERYRRKFTPRKDASQWSQLNRSRVQKLIEEGRMSRAGLEQIEAARRLGTWQGDSRPTFGLKTSTELIKALRGDPSARAYFESLAPSHRRHYLAWIETAKRPETRKRRVAEALVLLKKREKLGLK